MYWLGLLIFFGSIASISPAAAQAQRAKDACVIKRGDETAGVCYETSKTCADRYLKYRNQPCQRKDAYRCDTNQGTFFYYAPYSGYLRDKGNRYTRYDAYEVCNSLKEKLASNSYTKTTDACVITRGVDKVGICYETTRKCASRYRTFKNQPCLRKGAYRCDTKYGSLFIYSPSSGSVRRGKGYKNYDPYFSCSQLKMSFKKNGW